MSRVISLFSLLIAAFAISNCERCDCDGCEPKRPVSEVKPEPPSPPPPIVAPPPEDSGVVPQADEERPAVRKKPHARHNARAPAAHERVVAPTRPAEEVAPAAQAEEALAAQIEEPPPAEEAPPRSPPVAQPKGSIKIAFNDKMGDEFRLESYRVLIDGKEFMSGSSKTASLTKSLAPGSHAIDVEAHYSGKNSVFAYFNDYDFYLEDGSPGGINLTVDADDQVDVNIVGYLSGTCFARIEDRPSLRIDVGKNMPALAPEEARGSR